MLNFRHIFLCLLLLAFAFTGRVDRAYAARQLTGLADLSYAHWEREVGGAEVGTGEHFTQQYSLLYSMKDLINHGRGGEYELSLGFDWTSVDSEMTLNGTKTDFSLSTGKLLYQGDIRFEPGGLPFRIHAYARDMELPTLTSDGIDGFSGNAGSDFTDFDSGIVSNINDGTRFETGITLVAGIRNGSYLGKYRNLLSTLPKIFLDYKEVDVRDMKSFTPVKYRDRDLAFVSLNKKDNWFHYRIHSYTDFLQPDNGSEEQVLMLGTVDHRLQRQWINMTNWIQVSSDLSYTEYSGVGAAAINRDEKRFDVNLFTKLTRSNYRVANFTSFQRVRENNALNKRLEVPVFAKGNLDRNTSWVFNFIGDGQQSTSLIENTSGQGGYMSTRMEMYKQSRFVLAPFFAAEYREDEVEGTGSAARVGFEYFSNRAYKPKHALFGKAALSYFDTRDPALNPGEQRDYLETELTGKVESVWNKKFLTGIEQQFLFGYGELFDHALRRLQPQADLLQLEGDSQPIELQDTTFRSITTLYGEFQFRSRGQYRAELVADYLNTGTRSAAQFVLSDRWRVDNRTWRLNGHERLVLGDAVQGRVVSAGISTGGVIGQVALATGAIDFEASHGMTLNYSTSRNWEFGVSEDLSYTGAQMGDVLTYMLRQRYNYNIYHVNGVVRKLAEISQEFELEGIHQQRGADESLLGLLVSGSYYPTKTSLLSARVRYRYYVEDEQNEWTYILAAGLHYEKFKVDAEYAYGTRDESTTDLAVLEHRWELKMTKLF